MAGFWTGFAEGFKDEDAKQTEDRRIEEQREFARQQTEEDRAFQMSMLRMRMANDRAVAASRVRDRGGEADKTALDQLKAIGWAKQRLGDSPEALERIAYFENNPGDAVIFRNEWSDYEQRNDVYLPPEELTRRITVDSGFLTIDDVTYGGSMVIDYGDASTPRAERVRTEAAIAAEDIQDEVLQARVIETIGSAGSGDAAAQRRLEIMFDPNTPVPPGYNFKSEWEYWQAVDKLEPGTKYSINGREIAP